MRSRLLSPWPDRRAERTLGAVSLLIGAAVIAMIVFVAIQAWPTLRHNGLFEWLGSGGRVERQVEAMSNAGTEPGAHDFHLRAWPLVYGTLLTTAVAVGFGLVIAILSSIFIVELAHERLRRVVVPVIRLLASVPSVVYGLLGILVLVPFIGNHVVTSSERAQHAGEVQLTGQGLLVTVVILTLMITPIMVALICQALQSVPGSWREGAIALGVNPVRAMLAVTLRAARPAIVAAAVLATARALGESIMVAMVSGGQSFAPRPADGITAIFEPLRTLASFIVSFQEGSGATALKSTLYAFALLLLFSAFVLSVGGYLIKLPLRRHQLKG